MYSVLGIKGELKKNMVRNIQQQQSHKEPTNLIAAAMPHPLHSCHCSELEAWFCFRSSSGSFAPKLQD